MNRPAPRNNVIVCGSYRSGTTWLMEVLSAGIGCQYDFEPLEPSAHRAVRAQKLRNRYLSPDKNYETIDPVIDRIIRGRIIHPYIKGMSPHPAAFLRWKFWAPRHIIKLVQGHLLLGYIHRRFGFRNIVLLLRRPSAVIASLKRQAWWRSDLEEFLDDRASDLFADYPELREYVRRARDFLDADCPSGEMRKIGDTMIRYCLENYVPIRQHLDKAYGYRIVCYEDLVEDPENRVSALCGSLGIRFTGRHVRRLGRRSGTSSPAPRGAGPGGGGSPGLAGEERELVSRILTIFTFDSFFDGYFRPEHPDVPGTA